MRNLHKTYYKDYFKNLSFAYLLDNNSEDPKAEIKRRNGNLTAPNLLQNIPQILIVNKCFELKVEYPGLVTGIGIAHEAKIEGEFKLGVHFDWTYGMPVVYGSSVKGVLKSAFNDGYVDENLVKQANNKLKSDESDKMIPKWVVNEVDVILSCIFEGKDSKGNNLSIYDRDIFFDAVIVSPDSKRRILCSDSITPHGDNPLKNPTPLTFLKIAPGCKLEFRFKLTNSDFGEGKGLTADQKLTLFKEILTTVGVGAKTNVGYGQLKEVK